MTRALKLIIAIIATIIILWLYTTHKTGVVIVYPQDCTFFIDSVLSSSVQKDIQQFIHSEYKVTKKSHQLLAKIEAQFPVIKAITIDMQHSEQARFTVQAYQPLFLINNKQVVCQYGKIFDKDIFQSNIIARLQDLTFEDKISQKNIQQLVLLLEQIQNVDRNQLLHDFSIRWANKHEVWFDQKNNQEKRLSLLIKHDKIPTLEQVEECRLLREQIIDRSCQDKRGKSCKKNKAWICDLRFDQQIIFFAQK